jgi:hypothetical protein
VRWPGANNGVCWIACAIRYAVINHDALLAFLLASCGVTCETFKCGKVEKDDMPNDSCGTYFSDEILEGLIAKIGLPAYAVLSVIAAAESHEAGPVRMPLEKIAELMGRSVEMARSGMDTLKKHRLISIELQGRNNVYQVVPRSHRTSRAN